MSQVQLAVWYLNIVAMIALIIRLSTTGLFQIYRWFAIYLLVDLAESLIFFYFLQIKAYHAYGETYMGLQGVKMVLSVFVLLELYRVALASRPAIARFGRKAVRYAFALAAVIAGLGLRLDRSVPIDQSPVLYHYFAVERTMDLWALLFLVLITVFMLWFPVKLMQNAAFYLLGFIVYFSARSSGLLLVNRLPHRYQSDVDAVMLGVSFCCLLFWVIALRRENRDRTTVIGHRWDASAMGRLTAQLDAINDSLVRLSGDQGK